MTINANCLWHSELSVYALFWHGTCIYSSMGETEMAYKLILMVKCDGKVRTYASSESSIARADARDCGSLVEAYQVLGNGLFARLAWGI